MQSNESNTHVIQRTCVTYSIHTYNKYKSVSFSLKMKQGCFVCNQIVISKHDTFSAIFKHYAYCSHGENDMQQAMTEFAQFNEFMTDESSHARIHVTFYHYVRLLFPIWQRRQNQIESHKYFLKRKINQCRKRMMSSIVRISL